MSLLQQIMRAFLLLGFVLGCIADDEKFSTEDISSTRTEALSWRYDPNTLLDPPANFTADVQSDRILLTWIPNNNATYTVISDGNSAWSLESKLSSFHLTTEKFPHEFLTLTVKSCNEKGLCGTTVSVTVRTAPGVPSAPQNFTVTFKGKIVILNWKSPRSPKGPLDGYVLQYRSSQSSSSSELQMAGNQTSHEFSSLATNTLYYFNLKAFNNFKGQMISSDEVMINATTPPAAPSPPYYLQVNRINPDSVSLSWTSPRPYNSFIRWCFKQDCNSSTYNGSSSVYHTISGLKAGEVYKVEVFSFVVFRNDFILSSPASLQFQTTPNAQSLQLTARAISPTAVLISWTFESISEDILVSISWGSTEYVKSSLLSHIVSRLSSWSSYSFSVSLCNSIGSRSCSSSKVIAVVTPPDSFEAPTIARITAENSTSVILYWTDRYPSQKTYDGFQIRHCILDTLCKNMYTRKGSQEVRIHNLTPDTKYDFTVRAYTTTGLRKYFSKPAKAAVRTWKSVPEAPTNIQGTALSYEAVYIKWDISRSTVIDFEISFDGQKVRTEGNVKEIIIYGLEPLKLYAFTVRGCGSNGCGDGRSVSIRTKAGIPDAPGNLTVLRKSLEQIEVSWTAPPKFVANDTGYLLKWNCTDILDEVQLHYTVTKYTIFTPSKWCAVSLAAFSIEDDMLRLGEPAGIEITTNH